MSVLRLVFALRRGFTSSVYFFRYRVIPLTALTATSMLYVVFDHNTVIKSYGLVAVLLMLQIKITVHENGVIKILWRDVFMWVYIDSLLFTLMINPWDLTYLQFSPFVLLGLCLPYMCERLAFRILHDLKAKGYKPKVYWSWRGKAWLAR